MEPIEKAFVLKKELDSLRPLNREQEQRIMQKFRLDWNFHSNHLEGNSLTYGETKALILFGITAQGKPLKDHLEIEGHNEAIEWVTERVKGEYPLTESFIRELHQLLLKAPYWVNAFTPEGAPTRKKVEIGQYKSQENYVLTDTGEVLRFASPRDTPVMMEDMMKWYQEKALSDSVNPILLAAEFHYRFIRIHPFDDGNGRAARILMNFILMKYGFPPVIIKTQDKSNYLSALRQADSGIIGPSGTIPGIDDSGGTGRKHRRAG
jgi:Fic family protein